MARTIAVADIGGTNARFALARVEGGRVLSLGESVTLGTADHPSLQSAWAAFTGRIDEPAPTALAVAFAGPVGGDELKLVHNEMVIRRRTLDAELGIERHVVVNDFEAIGHAVAQLGPEHFEPICGPPGPLPAQGLTTIVGPGTGLGVAQLLRVGDAAHVIGSEGGHFDFAPLDAFEDALVTGLRGRHGRVSTERVVAGGGLGNIYRALAAADGETVEPPEPAALWTAALSGSDARAVAALGRFCRALGAVAGDVAVAHGANAVVIAGGIGLRLRHRLAASGFGERFCAKGRFAAHMAAMPVRLITHPQPGLFGAAAAFAKEYR